MREEEQYLSNTVVAKAEKVSLKLESFGYPFTGLVHKMKCKLNRNRKIKKEWDKFKDEKILSNFP